MLSHVEYSIVIVTWNAKKYVIECLDSLRGHETGASAEIIVVDNDSSDGTPDLIREQYPHVKLIQNTSNLGFAKANNIGIAKTQGKYVFLINSDVRVLGNCLESMLEYAEQHSDIGILGPAMRGADGAVNRSYSGFPSVWNCFCRALALDGLFPRSRWAGKLHMPYFVPDRIADLDVLAGWFWLVRRDAISKVGLLDENFFMYGEDVDWCKRFRAAGWRVVYYPEASAIHYGGASSSKAPIRFYIEMEGAKLRYWKKHHSRAGQIAYLAILCCHQLLRVLGYSALAGVGRDAEAKFKVARSLAFFRWLLSKQRSTPGAGPERPLVEA
jgi:GT2 family glycosyltransferase